MSVAVARHVGDVTELAEANPFLQMQLSETGSIISFAKHVVSTPPLHRLAFDMHGSHENGCVVSIRR